MKLGLGLDSWQRAAGGGGPSFTGRGAYFDGSTYYASGAISVAAGNQGLLSVWFKNAQSSWNVAVIRLLQFRVSTTITMDINTASSGRLLFRMNQDGTGSDTYTTPLNTFVINQWYHVLWAWDWAASRFQIYVNNSAIDTSAYSFTGATKFDQAGTNLTQIGIGAQSAGTTPWLGDIGHLWFDTNSTLDISDSANRAKFASAGLPVDLGTDGSTPTGSAPEYYYDGAGSAWNNQGTAGTVTLTGTLTASSTTPSY